MKNSIVLLMYVLFIGFAACTSSNTNKRYSEEDLIYRYLDTYFKDSIQQDNYKLFTFCTKNACRGCSEEPIEKVLDFVVNKHTNVYVLFDEEKYLQKTKDRYGDKIHYLLGEDKEMNRYGIPTLAPMLFTFENHKIVDYEHFDK